VRHEQDLFGCPDCGGTAFGLGYQGPITDHDIAAAEDGDAETAARLRLVRGLTSNHSRVHAMCAAESCEFSTSVTNIEPGPDE
jgi:hypothetical protein